MPTLNMLKIAFDAHISARDLPALRSSFYQQMTQKKPNEAFNYAYPLLQWKVRQSYGQQQPMIVCLGQHPQLYSWFGQHNNLSIPLNGKRVNVEVAYTKVTNFQLNCHNKLMPYHLFHYLALNNKHYPFYQQLEQDEEKRTYLADRIRHHILGFAKGIGWHIKDSICINVTCIRKDAPVQYQGMSFHRFDLDFESNVFIPEYVGLGRGVARGFGVVRQGKGKSGSRNVNWAE